MLIVTIQYNMLNLPEVVQFSDGHQICNLYAADGRKLKTDYYTQVEVLNAPIIVGDIKANLANMEHSGNIYVGDIEYEIDGGTYLKRINNPEGYFADNKFHYYRKDHLGNNREVWRSDGQTVQKTQYYASGLPWASNAGDNPSVQNYKYNGKEFIEMHGYDEYNYGARMRMGAVPMFITFDPSAEKGYHLSPYHYAFNNPVNFVDPDGRWSVSNHYIMTMGALANVNIKGTQAELLAYYASVYADNPGKHLKWNNLAHPRNRLAYRSDVDHSATMNAQVTAWRVGSPGMNENIRQSMRSDWEREAFENSTTGGISQGDAQLRGMQYGWDNVFSSAQKGHLKDFKANDVGLQEFGVGIHALQDGYGHAGVSMNAHSLYEDVYGNMSSSTHISQSAVNVHKLMSGDWSNLGDTDGFNIDMKGMSDSQREDVWTKFNEYWNR